MKILYLMYFWTKMKIDFSFIRKNMNIEYSRPSWLSIFWLIFFKFYQTLIHFFFVKIHMFVVFIYDILMLLYWMSMITLYIIVQFMKYCWLICQIPNSNWNYILPLFNIFGLNLFYHLQENFQIFLSFYFISMEIFRI